MITRLDGDIVLRYFRQRFIVQKPGNRAHKEITLWTDMIDVEPWMKKAVALLRERFGERLLFVGLQGSYRRGEARQDSDIDILTILDSLDVIDLAAYRSVLRELPEGEKAGGFTCGRRELLAWPPFELFQFAMDTDEYYGSIDGLLPPVTRLDTIAGARMAVSALHHFGTYLYLSGDESSRAEELKAVYKSAFFAMQLMQYLRCGTYAKTKKELSGLVSGAEAELLSLIMDADRYEERKRKDADSLFSLLLDWTGNMLDELAGTSAGEEAALKKS